MANILHATPVLPALNIKETIAFFEQHLGFTARHAEDDYGVVTRDGVGIHFWQCPDKHICENSSCRLTVSGVDEMFAQAQQAGIAHPNAKLEAKPWGTREFALLDPNGNLVWLVELD